MTLPFSTPLESLAWIAGWLEGEGAFIHHCSQRLQQNGRFYYSNQLVIKANCVDRDTIERAWSILGNPGSIRIRPPGINRQMQFEFSINGWDAYALMWKLYPWMSSRRQEKIVDVIDKWLQCKSLPHPVKG